VSYWEWSKLIGLSFLISTMMTTTALAIWWLIKSRGLFVDVNDASRFGVKDYRPVIDDI
jgi:hypothetical protein